MSVARTHAAPGLALLGALLLAPACGGGGPDPQRVVVVLVDTLRADAVGGPDSVTPNLDALADESVVFERAYASSGWTLPSSVSLLTSTWPSEHKATGKQTRLTPVSPDVSVCHRLSNA